MVISDLSRTNLLFNWIVPETPNTIVRGPLAERIPSRNDPGPESSRLLTWKTSPPRPPVADRPKPSAPGKASSALAEPGCASVAPGNIPQAKANSPIFQQCE